VTKRRRTRKLPYPGDVFLIPLKDGRFGVCRVLRRDPPAFVGKKGVLVAATPWTGNHVPDLSEPQLHEVLVLSHHGWDSERAVLWTSYPVPAAFTLLGSLMPTPFEMQLSSNTFGTWYTLSIYVLDQWRWDHEREAVLREDQARAIARTNQRETEIRQRQEYLAHVTLQDLRNKQRFANWAGTVSKDALQATRKVFHDTIAALIALGPDRPETVVFEKLEECIVVLNTLNMQYAGFIETLEREELCAEFEEIVHASGLGHHDNLADLWREW